MQALTILTVLLFASGLVTARDNRLSDDCLRGIADRNKCCDGVPDAWYAHLRNPKDCASFYQCEHGKPTWKACAKGTHWSVEADRCEWPHEANCTIDADPTSKPTSIPTESTTHASTGSTSGGSDLPSGCYDGSISAKICCDGITDWWVHLPDPENCGKFYHCDNGKAVHKDCPAGLHWSVAADKCDWPAQAGCSGNHPSSTTTKRPSTTDSTTEGSSGSTSRGSSSTTPGSSTTNGGNKLPEGCYDGSISAEICCDGITDWWVHLPDPENCGKFYHCDNGKAVHKDCPAGLHWSVTADKCDWPAQAGCSGSHPSSTTTKRPSTTDSTTEGTSGSTSGGSSSTTPGSSTTNEGSKLPDGCYDGSISADICCDGITDWWVHLPDPENCGKFYHCDNGKAVHKDCPAGLHWSVAADKCDWPAQAGCSGSLPSSTTTRRPSSTDSTTEGTSGSTSGGSSPTTPGSSTTNGGNKLPEGCYDGSISAEICCDGITDWWVHLPDPENCGKFYHCDNGKAVHKDCPAGLHWSVAADKCDWPAQAGCSGSLPSSTTTRRPSTTDSTTEGTSGSTSGGSSSTTPGSSTTNGGNKLPEGCYDGSISAEICCDGITDWWVHLPDPENCGKFYHCDNGKAVHKDCPAGLHWSVAADKCDWPAQADCSGSLPSSTTTRRPSTTDSTTEGTSGSTSGGSSSTTPGSSTTNGGNKLPEGCYDGSISAKICCDGITDWWVHLPDPENCGKFYHCDNGKAVHKDCPAGLHWSVVADKCDWPAQAGCSGNHPSSTTTKRPSTTDSTTEGTSGSTSGGSSSTTPGSSTTNGGNQLPEGCYDGSISADICCDGITDWWVHLPDPENCGKFYHCDNGKAVHKDCPAGLHWSVAADKCDWPAQAGCTGSHPSSTTTRRPSTTDSTTEGTSGSTSGGSSSTTPGSSTTNGGNKLPEGCYDGSISAEICCDGITDWWVHLPDPENCGKFYHCDNGKAVHKDCPAGLHWSVAADKCDWPAQSGCTGSHPSSTTTKRTSTPTSTTEGSSGSTSGGSDLPSGCYGGSISAKICCDGITDWWVHLPDPENCGKFYHCDNGKAVHKDCPAGLHWSVAADKCDWPAQAGCSGSHPSSSTTRRPSTTDSTTEGTSGSTSGGTSSTTPGSSTTNGGNKLPEGCYDGSISAEICCDGITDWWVHLPDPENCGKFYHCDNGKAVYKDCPAGLHWSVAADRCEWPELAGCSGSKPSSTTTNKPSTTEINTSSGTTQPPPPSSTASPSTPSENPGTNSPPTSPANPEADKCAPPPVCPQCITGIFPADQCCLDVKTYHKLELANGKDCSSYYQCVDGKAILRDCPSGLHWSVHSERCEWPSNAKCSANEDDGNDDDSGDDDSSEEDGSGTVSSDCLSGKISAEKCCKGVPHWVDVLLQNNADCHTFIQCVHEKPVVRPCPANLWWSITKNRCEWKENATCTW